MTATFESLNVTHILISCPRGFSNERAVYPIPADCAEDAARFAQDANPDGDVYRTRLIALSDAPASDRSEAGLKIRDFSTEEYRGFLYDLEGPLYPTLQY